MATTLLFPSTGAAPISPTPDVLWDVISAVTRLPCFVASQGTGVVSFNHGTTSGGNVNADHLNLQFISEGMAAGQIDAGTALTLVFRIQAFNVASDQFFAATIRVFSNDGLTVRGTVLTLSRDDVEIAADALRIRVFNAVASNTVSWIQGDRLVIEIGNGGLTQATGSHAAAIQVRDNSTLLPQTDNGTTAGNPHLIIDEDLTFGLSPIPAPSVTSITPNTGSTAGGEAVSIGGTDFVTGATVTIGGVAATGVTFVNSTQIDAVTPAGVAGAADVVVTNPDTQNDTLVGGFTYVAPSGGASRALYYREFAS